MIAERARAVVLGRRRDDRRASRRRGAVGGRRRRSRRRRAGVGELEDRRRVLGLRAARRDRVDPAHRRAVRVGLHRLEHDLVVVVGDAVGVDRELAELVRRDRVGRRRSPSSDRAHDLVDRAVVGLDRLRRAVCVVTVNVQPGFASTDTPGIGVSGGVGNAICTSVDRRASRSSFGTRNESFAVPPFGPPAGRSSRARPRAPRARTRSRRPCAARRSLRIDARPWSCRLLYRMLTSSAPRPRRTGCAARGSRRATCPRTESRTCPRTSR